MGLTKVCTICNQELPLEKFNKGNAKYNLKSWCKYCQQKRNSEYKKRPERRIVEREHSRKCYAKKSLEQKHQIYLQRKLYVEEWGKVNKTKLKKIAANRAAKRRTILGILEPLHLSSLIYLEHYNLEFFSTSSFVCEYCKKFIGDDYTLEHIIPITKNGTNELANLAIVCVSCNSSKRNKLLEEWNLELKNYIIERNNKWNLNHLNIGNHKKDSPF